MLQAKAMATVAIFANGTFIGSTPVEDVVEVRFGMFRETIDLSDLSRWLGQASSLSYGLTAYSTSDRPIVHLDRQH
jgi:hypothetical protein